jgi:hypothetical protein
MELENIQSEIVNGLDIVGPDALRAWGKEAYGVIEVMEKKSPCADGSALSAMESIRDAFHSAADVMEDIAKKAQEGGHGLAVKAVVMSAFATAARLRYQLSGLALSHVLDEQEQTYRAMSMYLSALAVFLQGTLEAANIVKEEN